MRTLQVLLLCALAGVIYGHVVDKIIGDAKNTIKGLSGIVTGGIFGVLNVHREEEIEPAPEEPPSHPTLEDDGARWSHRHKFYHHLQHHHGGRFGRPERPDSQGHEQPVLKFEPPPPPYGHGHPGYQQNQGHYRPVYLPEQGIHNTDQGYQHPGNYGHEYQPDQTNHQHQHGYRPNQGSELPGYRPDKPIQQPGWNQPDLNHNSGYQPDQGSYQPQCKPDQGNENPTYRPNQGNQSPGYQSSQGSKEPNGGGQPNINLEEKPNDSRTPDQVNHVYDGSGIPEYVYRPDNGPDQINTANPSQNGDVGSTSRPTREDNAGEENFELDVRSSFDDDRKT